MNDLATHDIDLTSWITGAEYRKVAARTMQTKGRLNEDFASVIGQLDIDIIVSHLVNRSAPFKERVVIVAGEKGCFVADNLNSKLTFFAPCVGFCRRSGTSVLSDVTASAAVQYNLPEEEPLVAEHEAFIDHLEGRAGRKIVPLSEGLRTLSVVEAVLKSADTRSIVRVSPGTET